MGAAATTGLLLGGISSAAQAAQAAQSNANAQAQAEVANANALASYEAQQKAAKVKAQQLSNQAAVERDKVSSQAHQIESNLRVAAGESGIGQGGTYNALARQTAIDSQREKNIINQNLEMGVEYTASQIEPLQLVSASQYDVVFPALTGGFKGFSTGLSIGNQLNKFK